MLRLLILSMIIGAVSAQGYVGGWTNIYPIDETIHKIAEQTLVLYDDAHTWGLAQRLVKLRLARGQVVAGMNYQFLLTMGVMNCPEELVDMVPWCRVFVHANCFFQVYKDLSDKLSITKSQCGNFKYIY